ncbi:MAG: hypothetical protein MK033_08445 [Candidatus Caenarcaniphilales bacterium]|nr:hypothetical protein [Candidatus Caenarcaniphilales bacterium]
MSYFYSFSPEKNRKLQDERGISFEEIIFIISNKGILDILEHHNPDKYPNQKIFVVNIDNYAYLVPAVFDQEQIFLKTIIPSRKATRKYIGEDNYEL